MDKLFKQLLTPEVLTRGWHLARLDCRQDFAEDLYSTDVYGQDLGSNIKETINKLRTSSYLPRPLLRMEVPKGSLGFRPGTVIPIHDRVVASSIVLLIAPTLDGKLPDSVYSWRVKNPPPKNGALFRESDITDLPFLKKATIRKRVDPFDPWYALWPEFDDISRSLFQKEGFRYLATSDISAYFENIQLPILRDQLIQHLPAEAQILNLLFSFLESWTVRTADGRPHFRGIPQGNFISSFLGNLFLLPLDLALTSFAKEHNVSYYRYMDDVRIFAKDMHTARLAVFCMDRTLRELHLNVQTAKTKIFDEAESEITKHLIDSRVDEFSDLIERIQSLKNGAGITKSARHKFLGEIARISRKEVPDRQKIVGSRRPLDGMETRVFSRWITAHSLIGSDRYIGRLLLEINRSADFKLTRKLQRATKDFPRKRSVETLVMEFLKSHKNIFPFQEAECLRALRYLSRISDTTIEYCFERLKDKRADPYVRMQSCYLLSRLSLEKKQLTALGKLFEDEANAYVQCALACALVQRRENNQEVIRILVLHSNEKVRDLGKMFRATKYDRHAAKARLSHVFRQEAQWGICDNMPHLFVMANSPDARIRTMLLHQLNKTRKTHPLMGIRETLEGMHTRIEESLHESLTPRATEGHGMAAALSL